MDQQPRWKLLSGTNFILQFVIKNEGYEIFITDLVRLYIEKVNSAEQVLKLCQTFNPDIEVSQASDLIQQISKIFDSKDLVVKTTVAEDFSFNNVSIVSSVYGCQFSWFFKLARSTDEEFFSILTEPNMKISINLVEAQKQLIQLNKAKDEEIKDYKSNGATLVRQTLETKPFSSFVLEPVPTPDFVSFMTGIDYVSELQKAKENAERVKKKEENLTRHEALGTKAAARKQPSIICPIGAIKKAKSSQDFENTQKNTRQKNGSQLCSSSKDIKNLL